VRYRCASADVGRYHFLDCFWLNIELPETRQGTARNIVRLEKVNLAGSEGHPSIAAITEPLLRVRRALLDEFFAGPLEMNRHLPSAARGFASARRFARAGRAPRMQGRVMAQAERKLGIRRQQLPRVD
jgi:hypothetical protein